MRDPIAVAVSPDGANVYVAGSYSYCVVVFDRDLSDGTLTYSQSICGFSHFSVSGSLAVAPDGNHVYAAGNYFKYDYDEVAVYARDPVSGQLSFVEVQVEGISSVTGLLDPTDVALTPDGSHVFVSAKKSLVAFSRDAITGGLRFINADFNLEGVWTAFQCQTR